MGRCNICGGTEFERGPGERLSATGELPRCVACRSLERHRSLHGLFAYIPRPMLSWRRALQFAPDNSLDPGWFRSYEPSEYRGENSIDLEAVDRADGSYDLLSLSLVLEFVADDRRAFGELVRIGSDACILHCTFDSNSEDQASTDYEEPHGAYGRLHVYGLDLEDRFETDGRGLSTLVACGTDPVTGLTERFHFFCRQTGDAETLRAAFEAGSPGSVELFHPAAG